MATITLTTSPQSITGSDAGVIVSGGTFMYGFGASSPTQGIYHDEESGPLDYGGSYGLMWVWGSTFDADALTYFLAS
jgi:hypothetical protein